MSHVHEHLQMLGLKVRDKVTEMEGVVASISFDLYGCVQAIVNPGLDKDGKPRDTYWFDVNRLTVLSDVPVMERPNFVAGPQALGLQGPSEKPASNKP
jgi:hypothetical protein